MIGVGNYKLVFTATRLCKKELKWWCGQGQARKEIGTSSAFIIYLLNTNYDCEQSTTWCVAALSLFIVVHLHNKL